MQSVEVEILGRRYRLRGEDPDKIVSYADYLNKELNNLAQHMEFADSTQVLVLGALGIVEQLFLEREQKDGLQDEMDRLRGLLESL